MKKIKIIDTANGQITLYDDETYRLKRRFKSYKNLVKTKSDLFYDLIDSGFIVRQTEVELDVQKGRIVFVLNVKMTFYK